MGDEQGGKAADLSIYWHSSRCRRRVLKGWRDLEPQETANLRAPTPRVPRPQLQTRAPIRNLINRQSTAHQPRRSDILPILTQRQPPYLVQPRMHLRHHAQLRLRSEDRDGVAEGVVEGGVRRDVPVGGVEVAL